MEVLERVRSFLTRILAWIAGLFLGAMIVVTCANIFLRSVWMPVRGTFEFMGYFGAVVTALALGYSQMNKGHISVDILVTNFSKKVQRILNGINNAFCTIFFIIVSWQIAKYATTLLNTGEVTETLRVPYYPFTYAVALGCAVLSFIFLTDFIINLIRREEDIN